MVLLPDHLHAVWTLPPGDADFPIRWRLIKTWFSRKLPYGEHRRTSRVSRGERGIWQRRYWEHLIRDLTDYVRHVDYVRMGGRALGNPPSELRQEWRSYRVEQL
jgi:putative transposase